MYSKSCQTSKMEHFANLLTISPKTPLLDIWQGSENPFAKYKTKNMDVKKKKRKRTVTVTVTF